MWKVDSRFPGWEFRTVGNILYARNKELGKSGYTAIPDSHDKFRYIDLDNKKKYLIECASADPELWLL